MDRRHQVTAKRAHKDCSAKDACTSASPLTKDNSNGATGDTAANTEHVKNPITHGRKETIRGVKGLCKSLITKTSVITSFRRML